MGQYPGGFGDALLHRHTCMPSESNAHRKPEGRATLCLVGMQVGWMTVELWACNSKIPQMLSQFFRVAVCSAFGVSTLRLQHCSNTSGHARDQVAAHLAWDVFPLGLHALPQLMD